MLNKDEALDELKSILYEDENNTFSSIEKKIETLDFQLHNKDEILSRIEPLFEEVLSPAISKEIENNKEQMIDALYPIMGGMISKYVSQAIKEMMETINKKIESGLSFERYKRKIKAKLTGVSETELLMEESSDATISSLFVIQKESSLLIAEAHLENQEIDDAHMVASMASAIKDFINDWVKNDVTGSEIQILSYGNATLYIESAGSVFIIAFLDAEPDYEQRAKINAFFASVIKKYSDFFQHFDGDDSAEEIVSLSKKMEDYLYDHAPKHTVVAGKPKKNPAKYILIFLGLLLLGYGIYFFNAWYIQRSLEHNVYIQTGEKISIRKKEDALMLEGQISSLEKIAKIRNTIKHYEKNVRIQNNLTVPVTYLDQRFKAVNSMGEGSAKSMNEKFKLLERSFLASIDSLNNKVLKLNQSLDESKTELSAMMKRKDDEISGLKHDKETLEKVIAIKSEINQKLDNALNGNPYYLPDNHALDFGRLKLFEPDIPQYKKDAIVKVAKAFELYINVLVAYREYLQGIEIEGHSDSSGLETDNMILSKKRALSVKYYLERLSIVKQYHMDRLIHANGYGSSQKIMHDHTEDKDASRRIKIKFELNDSKIINRLRGMIND